MCSGQREVEGYCSRCAKRAARFKGPAGGSRGNTTQRGYGWKYQQNRRLRLAQNPICQVCGRARSVETDHIVSLAEGGSRVDLDNLRAVCEACHDAKSGRDRARINARPISLKPAPDEDPDVGY